MTDIFESFSWLTPEFSARPTDGRTIKIKGKAIPRETISKNQRKYVGEELKKAARSFIDVPITINHSDWSDKKNQKGKVNWMEYDDSDGSMEYVGEVWDNETIAELRLYAKDPTLSRFRGVSIEADFLHIRCTKCGRDFHSEEEWRSHMVNEEYIKDFTLEPHGIRGRALSLVASPEVAGVSGNTLEVMESIKPRTRGFSCLLETVITTKKIEEEYELSRIALNKQDSIAIGKTRVASQESKPEPTAGVAGLSEQTKEETEEKKEEKITTTEASANKIVGNTITDSGYGISLNGSDEDAVQQREPLKVDVELKSTETKQVTVKEGKVEALKESVKEKLGLGEPFGGYSDFAACVSANKDKDNPEAYCGKIKHQTEGEMLRDKRLDTLEAKLNEVIGEVNKPVTIKEDDVSWKDQVKAVKEAVGKVVEHVNGLPKDDLGWKQIKPYDDAPLKKQIEESKYDDAEVRQLISDIKPYDDTQLKDAVTKLQEEFEKLPKIGEEDIEKIKDAYIAELALYKKDIEEYYKPELEKLKKRVEESAQQKLKETQEATEKLKTLETKVENLEDKQKPSFKGKGKLNEEYEVTPIDKEKDKKKNPDFSYKPGGA